MEKFIASTIHKEIYYGITADDANFILELTFEQLKALRHRGAFSAVAQAFATGCGIPDEELMMETYEVSEPPNTHVLASPLQCLLCSLSLKDAKMIAAPTFR
jgi:hypothetical protein